jgi:hypothetical protein
MRYSNVRLAVLSLYENKGQTLNSWSDWTQSMSVTVDGTMVGTLESDGWAHWGFRRVGGELVRVDASIYNWWKPLSALLGEDHKGRRPVTAEDWYWALALSIMPHQGMSGPALNFRGPEAVRAFDEWVGRQSTVVTPENGRLTAAMAYASACEQLPFFQEIVEGRVAELENIAYVQGFLASPLRDQVRQMFLAQRQDEEAGVAQDGTERSYADNSTEITLQRPDGRRIRQIIKSPSGDLCF